MCKEIRERCKGSEEKRGPPYLADNDVLPAEDLDLLQLHCGCSLGRRHSVRHYIGNVYAPAVSPLSADITPFSKNLIYNLPPRIWWEIRRDLKRRAIHTTNTLRLGTTQTRFSACYWRMTSASNPFSMPFRASLAHKFQRFSREISQPLRVRGCVRVCFVFLPRVSLGP